MFANIIHAAITVSTAAHCLTRNHGNEEVVTDQEDLPSRTEVSAVKVCINSPPDKSVYGKCSKIFSFCSQFIYWLSGLEFTKCLLV